MSLLAFACVALTFLIIVGVCPATDVLAICMVSMERLGLRFVLGIVISSWPAFVYPVVRALLSLLPASVVC